MGNNGLDVTVALADDQDLFQILARESGFLDPQVSNLLEQTATEIQKMIAGEQGYGRPAARKADLRA
jgi:hypothetical protein